jgi:hypothetical protein
VSRSSRKDVADADDMRALEYFKVSAWNYFFVRDGVKIEQASMEEPAVARIDGVRSKANQFYSEEFPASA